MSAYDYIVVGGGSAGCCLANRLSADVSARVLLIEAGPKKGGMKVDMPAMIIEVVPPNPLNWNYWTAPQKHLDDRKLFWPRGKVLGGSSAINGMLYVRGHARDYDEWAQLGCTGWSYDDVLPYFIKSEASDRPADDFHGNSGVLRTSQHTSVNPLNEAFLEAGRELGWPETDDFNGAVQEGVGWYDQTIHQGRRQTTAHAFLPPEIQARQNLDILFDTQALHLLIKDRVCTGIRVRDKAGDRDIMLRDGGELVLSGGAINSPQVLQLSGIGDPDQIQRVGLPVLHELKGVGHNLQDHLDVTVYARLKDPISVLKYQAPHRAVVELAKWFMKMDGVMSDCVTPVGGFLKTDPALERPDIQFHIMLAMADAPHGFEKAHEHGFGIHICQLRPHSRGFVGLESSDPMAPALIDPNYLAADEDLRILREGTKMLRQMYRTDALSPFITKEKEPFDAVGLNDDAALDAVIRQKAETIYHPVGTCAMGPKDNANSVVDPRLKVIGLDALRVADASVMPRLIGGNTNAPTIMIAEKCADMMLADRKAALGSGNNTGKGDKAA